MHYWKWDLISSNAISILHAIYSCCSRRGLTAFCLCTFLYFLNTLPIVPHVIKFTYIYLQISVMKCKNFLDIKVHSFFLWCFQGYSYRVILLHPFYLLKLLTHWGRGHLNCLNARSRGLFNLNQLLYCVSLKIYNKFANYEGWNFNSGNYLFTTDTK